MATKKIFRLVWAWLSAVLIAIPPGAYPQQSVSAPLRQEEIEQLVAPIALYPDPLISQILMASTYPLEIVQASRWGKQNANLKGDALTDALEKQNWDPSVKSLVNFPQVLDMMNEKLELTQRLGDAFLADQKRVMDAIQGLRAKARSEGNLQTTKEQNVIVEEKIIKIEPADPQVIYVPTYNPTVVYGAWPYPAYPPYSYYPPGYVYPGYVAGSMFAFGAGVAMGAAWGYAWGNCNWGGGDIKYNFNQNINVNNKIDRGKYANQVSSNVRRDGNWQHNADHRKGVSYRDQGTAQKFNRASSNDAVRSREQFRGRAEQGRQDLARGGGLSDRGAGQGPAGGDRAATANRAGAGDRANAARDRAAGGGSQNLASSRGTAGDRAGAAGQLGGGNRSGAGSSGGAFQGVDRGGSAARSASQRGSSSRGSFSGGGARSGGGGGRGGGGRR